MRGDHGTFNLVNGSQKLRTSSDHCIAHGDFDSSLESRSSFRMKEIFTKWIEHSSRIGFAPILIVSMRLPLMRPQCESAPQGNERGLKEAVHLDSRQSMEIVLA
jgi:hypothetical protein